MNSNFSKEIVEDDMVIRGESKDYAFYLNTSLSGTYGKLTKRKNLHEFEFARLSFDRITPNPDLDTLIFPELNRNEFSMSLALKYSFNINLLQNSANNFFTLGPEITAINDYEKDITNQISTNQIITRLGFIAKYGHVFKNHLYLESSFSAKVMEYSWSHHINKNSSILSAAQIWNETYFRSYVNSKDFFRGYEVLGLKCSLGYNF